MRRNHSLPNFSHPIVRLNLFPILLSFYTTPRTCMPAHAVHFGDHVQRFAPCLRR
jgi:hypothetical protein